MKPFQYREKALRETKHDDGKSWQVGDEMGIRRSLDEGTTVLVLWHDGWRECDPVSMERGGAAVKVKTAAGGYMEVEKRLWKKSIMVQVQAKPTEADEKGAPF